MVRACDGAEDGDVAHYWTPSLDAGKVMTADDIDSKHMLLAVILARVSSIDFRLAKWPTDDRGGCGVDRASSIPARWRCVES